VIFTSILFFFIVISSF